MTFSITPATSKSCESLADSARVTDAIAFSYDCPIKKKTGQIVKKIYYSFPRENRRVLQTTLGIAQTTLGIVLLDFTTSFNCIFYLCVIFCKKNHPEGWKTIKGDVFLIILLDLF